MKKRHSPLVLFLALIFIPAANASGPPRGAPRAALAPPGRAAGARTMGYQVVPHRDQAVHPLNNPPHQVLYHNARTGQDEGHPVIIEHRPAHVIDRDPHLRIARLGYRPLRVWDHFHPVRGGWWRFWGITAWDTVGTVTCEAANEVTGELYPVSEDRDATGWDDAAVNTMLDQALDDCAAEAGPNPCVPVTPACTFQSY